MNLNITKKIVAYASTIILIVCLLNVYNYYKAFGIPMQYFISFTDIISLSQATLMNVLIYTFGIIAALILSPINRIIKFDNEINKEREEINKNNDDNKLEKLPKALSFKKQFFGKSDIIIYFIIGVIMCLAWIVNDNFYLFTILRGIGCILIYDILLKLAIFRYTDLYEKNVSILDQYALFGLISSIVVTIFLTKIEVYEIQSGKYMGTKVITSDTTYKTEDSTTLFVGKTEKYIFLKDTKNGNSIIVPQIM